VVFDGASGRSQVVSGTQRAIEAHSDSHVVDEPRAANLRRDQQAERRGRNP
jgi:hypothetical protein